MMRYPLVVVALLFVASFALGAQQADPGVVASVTLPVVVANGVVSCGTVRVTVQKVLHPRPLTDQEDRAVTKYMGAYGADLIKAGNYEATECAVRLLLGIEQSHLPLTRRPVAYLSDAQVVWQMLKFLELYANVPAPPPTPDYSLPLGETLQPQYPQAVGWQPKVNGVLPETKEIQPIVQRCPMPVYAQTAGNGPVGRENNVSVARIVPDLTPLAWMLVWRALEHKPTPPKPPTPPDNPPDCGPGNPPVGPGGDDLTNPTNPCDPTPPGGTPGGMTGVPDGYSGSGNIAPGNPSGPGGAPYNPPPPATPGQGGGSPPGPDGPPATPIGGDL